MQDREQAIAMPDIPTFNDIRFAHNRSTEPLCDRSHALSEAYYRDTFGGHEQRLCPEARS